MDNRLQQIIVNINSVITSKLGTLNTFISAIQLELDNPHTKFTSFQTIIIDIKRDFFCFKLPEKQNALIKLYVIN